MKRRRNWYLLTSVAFFREYPPVAINIRTNKPVYSFSPFQTSRYTALCDCHTMAVDIVTGHGKWFLELGAPI